MSSAVAGPNPRSPTTKPEFPKELLAIIHNHFSDIYGDLKRRIEYKELIPCNCGECSARIEEDKEPHYFNWSEVQRYARRNLETIRCGGESLTEVNVATLMGAIPDSLIDVPTLREPVSQDTRQRKGEGELEQREPQAAEKSEGQAPPKLDTKTFLVAGSFCLLALVVVVGGLAFLSQYLTGGTMTLVTIGGVLFLLLVFAFVALFTGMLGEETTRKIVNAILSKIPGLKLGPSSGS